MLTAFSPFALIIVSLLFDFHLFLPPATVVARRQCLPSANEVARVGMCDGKEGWGACVAEGTCMEGGMCGMGICMAEGVHGGGGHVWQGGAYMQDGQPLKRTVRILLVCILVQQIFPLAHLLSKSS